MSDAYIHFIWQVNILLAAFLLSIAAFSLSHVRMTRLREKKRLRRIVQARLELQELMRSAGDEMSGRFEAAFRRWSAPEILEIFGGWIEPPAPVKASLKRALESSGHLERIEREALQERLKWLRIRAMIFLGRFGGEPSAGILVQALNDPDEDVAYFALLSLGEIKSERAASVLLQRIADSPRFGQKIASLLENFSSSIIKALIPAARHPSERLRFWAVKLLTHFQAREAFSIARGLSRDPSADVRAALCGYLSLARDKEASAILKSLLRDEAWFVRMHAARALFDLEGAACFPALAPLIHDSAAPVQESIQHLFAREIETALPYVEDCLAGPEGPARFCIGALVESGYVERMLGNFTSEEDVKRRQSSKLLQRMVLSGVYFGLKRKLEMFPAETSSAVFAAVREVRPDLAAILAGRR